jgi:hypothetical protein
MGLIDVDKSNVRLVYERRGLEGLAEHFLSQLGGCQLAQFLVRQRQQLLRRRRIARFDLRPDLGDVGHKLNLDNHLVLQHHFRFRAFRCVASQVLRCDSVA